jgi:hypothetical protein
MDAVCKSWGCVQMHETGGSLQLLVAALTAHISFSRLAADSVIDVIRFQLYPFVMVDVARLLSKGSAVLVPAMTLNECDE